MTRTATTDSARLVSAGWRFTQSNRWHHQSFPGVDGRVRLFTLPDALALLDADPSRTEGEQP